MLCCPVRFPDERHTLAVYRAYKQLSPASLRSLARSVISHGSVASTVTCTFTCIPLVASLVFRKLMAVVGNRAGCGSSGGDSD